MTDQTDTDPHEEKRPGVPLGRPGDARTSRSGRRVPGQPEVGVRDGCLVDRGRRDAADGPPGRVPHHQRRLANALAGPPSEAIEESPMKYPTLRTIDYHTGGEPFRIVPELPGTIEGATVAERRVFAMNDPAVNGARQVLCFEPRGHADMYGGFITPPDDEGAAFGVLFWHKDGFSTACGHGTIALGVWAIESGLIQADPSGVTDVVIDVPSGRVTARVHTEGGRAAVGRLHQRRQLPDRGPGAGVDLEGDARGEHQLRWRDLCPAGRGLGRPVRRRRARRRHHRDRPGDQMGPERVGVRPASERPSAERHLRHDRLRGTG